MEFECFKCGKEFNQIKYIFLHLKLNHFIKNDTTPTKCLVKGNNCKEEFYCFDKLKSHMKNCRSNSTASVESKPNCRPTILEKTFENVHVPSCVSNRIGMMCLENYDHV